MDSSDIYYSDDNSQLIDDNNSEWMENTVFIENQNITWQEDGPEITVDYTESPVMNKNLTENDGYLTAETEDSNEASQYFSILESNCDETGNNLNVIQNDTKCVLNVAIDKEEVILPDMPKYDEHTEKENESSDLSDSQVILYRMEGSDDLYALQLADDGNGNYQKYKYKVRQNEDGQFEAIPGSIEIQKADQTDLILQENNSNIEEIIETLEQKPNISSNMLNEPINDHFYMNNDSDLDTSDEYLLRNEFHKEEHYEDIEITNKPKTERNLHSTEFVNSSMYSQEDNSEDEYEVEELDDAFQDENINDNEDCSQILQHKLNINNINVSDKESRSLDNREGSILKDEKHLSYLVVKVKEKENVSSSNFKTTNLRSILKSNFQGKTKNSVQKFEKPSIISSKTTKEIKQINTIALKSARQPRKQTIKPIERAGSEIIVQPLVYSLEDNNEPVIFTMPKKRKRIMEEVLQVSDESDPEFTLKPRKKRRSKHTRRGRPKSIEITILDTDEEEEVSEESVIEVLTDEETSDLEEIIPVETVETNKKITEDKKENTTEDKKEVETKIVNKKNKCPLCPKTFPRLITLKKHMNIHSARRFLRSQGKSNETETDFKKPEEKNENMQERLTKSRAFNCTKCKLKFLTETQYKRHQTVHKTKISTPKEPIDKQSSKYLRSHSKLNEINLRSQRLSQRNKRTFKEVYKCEYCGQNFIQRNLLLVHRNSHKTFPCPNCKTTFTAKLLLDDHLRKSCVKSPNKKKIKTSLKCDVCLMFFQTTKSLQMHKNVMHKPKLESHSNKLEKKKRTHGGVPVSLKMQQALNRMKVAT